MKNANAKTACFKVEAARGTNADRGSFIAMISSDEFAPEDFAGTETECWTWIDSKRALLRQRDIELTAQHLPEVA